MVRRLTTVVVLLAALAAKGEEYKRGEIVDGVVCPSDPAITYAYYLPRAYTSTRPWPTLYVFDPRQRGAFAAGLFREAAEEFGWILISSNYTRSDSDIAPNIRALEATLPDARQRFAVDPARQYAAGFSGTAILAWALAATSSEIAGVIGCSGRPVDAKSNYDVPFAWFGTAGDRDFNYIETMDIDRGLAKAKGIHRLEVFEGGHRWAPPEIIRRGVEWLEIEAMKRGTRSRDDVLISRSFEGEMDAARAENDLLRAARRYEAIGRTFDGLLDVSSVRVRTAELRDSPACSRARDEEARAEKMERTQLRRFPRAINDFIQASEPPRPPALAHALDIPRLMESAKSRSYNGLAAQRVLEAIYAQLDFYLVRQLSGQKLSVAKNVAGMIHPPAR